MKKIIFIFMCLLTFQCPAKDFGMEFSKAVRNGDIATVEKMINYYGFEVNGKEGDTSPLHWAAEAGQAEMAKWLISKGAKVNARNMARHTPLHVVSYMESKSPEKYFESAKVLVENGADLNARGGVSAVSGMEYKETPLIIASRAGNFEIVKLLVEHGADVNAKNYDDITALHEASGKYNIELIKYLLSKKADVNAVSKEVQWPTPLFLAVGGDYIPVAKILVKYGADLHKKNNKNETPYDFAVHTGRKQMAEYLKKAEETQKIK